MAPESIAKIQSICSADDRGLEGAKTEPASVTATAAAIRAAPDNRNGGRSPHCPGQLNSSANKVCLQVLHLRCRV